MSFPMAQRKVSRTASGKRIGRPPKHKQALLKARHLRLTQDQSDAIDKIVAADKSGTDFSSVCRQLIVEALEARGVEF